MRPISISGLFVLVVATSQAQTNQELEKISPVQAEFNRAMVTQDGRLFHKNLSPVEQKVCTPAACSAFLKLHAKSWLNSPSFIRLDPKVSLTLGDPRHLVIVQFKPNGGVDYVAVNKRKVIFWTPTKSDGRRTYSTVSIGQILFSRAYDIARTARKGGLTNAKYAQKLVESWIPQVQKMGFKGSVDPEFGKFQTWAEIIRASRGEIK